MNTPYMTDEKGFEMQTSVVWYIKLFKYIKFYFFFITFIIYIFF